MLVMHCSTSSKLPHVYSIHIPFFLNNSMILHFNASKKTQNIDDIWRCTQNVCSLRCTKDLTPRLCRGCWLVMGKETTNSCTVIYLNWLDGIVRQTNLLCCFTVATLSKCTWNCIIFIYPLSLRGIRFGFIASSLFSFELSQTLPEDTISLSPSFCLDFFWL